MLRLAMGRITKAGRKATAALTTAAISLTAVFTVGFAAPANAAVAACGTAGAPSVTLLSDPTFHINTTGGFDANYIGYAITTPTAVTNLWVELTGFTGGIVSLAPGQPSGQDSGNTTAGGTVYTYFLGKATGATTTAQSHTVNLYSGNPNYGGATQLCTTTGSFARVDTTGTSNANKVSSVTVSTTGSSVGSTATVTAVGDTGTIGNGPAYDPGVINLAPTAVSSFPAGTWRLISTKYVSPINTYNNVLHLANAKADQGAYTATYTFQAVNSSGATAQVNPVQYIASGTNVQRTGSTVATLPTVPAVSNTLTVATAANKTYVPNVGGQVTYTTTVSNSGSSAVSIDDVFDLLPAGASYVAGTAKIDNVAATPTTQVNATTGRTTLVFPGPFSIPATGSKVYTYTVNLPAGYANLSNAATAAVSSTVIDTTLSTTDSAPAAVSVLVAPPAPSLSAPSVNTTGTAPVTFIPGITGTGVQASAACLVSGASCVQTMVIAGEGTYRVDTATGEVSFTAVLGFSGTTSPVTYRATDQYQQTGTVTVTISIAKPAAPTVTASSSTVGFREVSIFTPGTSANTVASSACIVSGASCVKSLTTAQGFYSVDATTGQVTFTPGTKFWGTATAQYRITDTYGQTGTNIISVTVGNPKTPTLSTLNITADYMTETHGNLSVGAGDGLVDTFCLISGGSCVSSLTSSAGVWSVNSATGEVTFTPASGFVGNTSVTARVTDDLGLKSEAAISAHVNTPAEAVFGDSNASGPYGAPVTFTPSVSATVAIDHSLSRLQDPADGQWKTVVTVSTGKWTVNGDGTVTFDPNNGYTGSTAPITMRVTDGLGREKTASISATINIPAPPVLREPGSLGTIAANPVVNDIPYGTVEYMRPVITGTNIQPGLARLLDPADNQWKTRVTIPGQGEWKVYPYAGKVEFVALRTFYGKATPIQYRAEDAWGQKETSYISVDISLPDVPVIGNVSSNFAYGGTKLFYPSFQGVRPQGSTAMLLDPSDNKWKKTVTVAGQGTWKVYNGVGNVEFVANRSFSGAVTPIQYRISDYFGQWSTSTLSANVGKPDAPVVADQTATLPYQSSLTHTIPAHQGTLITYGGARLLDPADNAWKTSIVMPGEGTWKAYASGKVEFVALKAFSGQATPVQYRVTDVFGQSDTSWIRLTVGKPAIPAVANLTVGRTDYGLPGTVLPVFSGTAINYGSACLMDPVDSVCKTTVTTSEGTWKVSTLSGRISFTPALKYDGITREMIFHIHDAFGQNNFGSVRFIVGAKVFGYFGTATAAMNSTLSASVASFASKVNAVPYQAQTITVSAYLPPAYTLADENLAMAHANAVIAELAKYGVTATRGANIQGTLAADMKQVVMKSSYVG